MKKTFLFLLLCWASFSLKAQISIGLQSGYVLSGGNFDTKNEFKTMVIPEKGFTYAIPLYYHINKHWAFGIEPGFIKRGASFKSLNINVIINGQTRRLYLDYLQMPIFTSLTFPLWNNKLELFTKIGFDLSNLVSSRRLAYSLFVHIRRDDIKDDINLSKWDMGISGGLGIAFNVGVNQIFIENTYYQGLKNIDRTFAKSKNRSLHLSLGYRYVLD